MEKKKSVPLSSLTQFSYYCAVCHPPLAWILLHTKGFCEKAGRGELGSPARAADVSAQKKNPLSISTRTPAAPTAAPTSAHRAGAEFPCR